MGVRGVEPRVTAASLAIIWHSRTGAAEALARAAADGGGTAVRLIAAAQAGPTDLLEAGGDLFVCPENLGSMSGMLKDFFDRTYYPVLERVNGRPYAAMICAGSDGQGAARQIERIALGWRLKAIAPSLIIMTHAQSPDAILAQKNIGQADLQRCRDLAGALAGGLALSIF